MFMYCIILDSIILRSIGIPIHTFMVNEEAKDILKRQQPSLFHDENNPPYEFSAKWRTSFFGQHRFSVQQIGMKKKVMTDVYSSMY